MAGMNSDGYSTGSIIDVVSSDSEYRYDTSYGSSEYA